jgi:hypothetical protein
VDLAPLQAAAVQLQAALQPLDALLKQVKSPNFLRLVPA